MFILLYTFRVRIVFMILWFADLPILIVILLFRIRKVPASSELWT